MKRKLTVIAALVVMSGALAARAADAPKKSAAELEKEKAMANPYSNDFGPDHLDEETLKSYPADKVEGYKLMLTRCSQCHTPSRPLNSRFVEPYLKGSETMKPAERDAKEDAAIAKMKKDHPEYFKNDTVWQYETGVWNRYVKRMMSKPGCGIDAGGKMTKPEAKKIYEFLQFDGEKRKLGANAEKWKAHRLKLIEELKAKKPERYKELSTAAPIDL